MMMIMIDDGDDNNSGIYGCVTGGCNVLDSMASRATDVFSEL